MSATPKKKENPQKVQGQNKLPENRPRRRSAADAPSKNNPNAQYEEKDES